MSMDWKKDGHLLAICGGDQNVKIYDKREGQVIRVIGDLHRGIEHEIALNRD